MKNSTQLAPFKKTGLVWHMSPRNREATVREVCRNLGRVYGRPRFGNPSDPLDDLIYIMLSNKTSPRSARSTFKRLRDRFGTWDDVLCSPLAALRSVLRPAGLSTVKSRQIRAALRTIRRNFGVCDLRSLGKLSAAEAERYLVGLPGVSENVAKCVM